MVHGRPQGGGARVGGCPTLECQKNVLAIWGPFLLLFLNTGAFLLCCSPYVGPFSSFGGLFPTFFSCEGALFGLAPPPTKISAGAHDMVLFLERELHDSIT